MRAPSVQQLQRLMELVRYVIFPDYSDVPSWTNGEQAIRELLEEHGYPVEEIKILRVGRDETEGFEERSITDSSKYFEIFQSLLKVYYIKRELGWR